MIYDEELLRKKDSLCHTLRALASGITTYDYFITQKNERNSIQPDYFCQVSSTYYLFPGMRNSPRQRIRRHSSHLMLACIFAFPFSHGSGFHGLFSTMSAWSHIWSSKYRRLYYFLFDDCLFSSVNAAERFHSAYFDIVYMPIRFHIFGLIIIRL